MPSGAAIPSPAHPRQCEVLRLVAAGHTNAQVTRRLGVTEGTVGTHLEISTKGWTSPAAPPPSPVPFLTGLQLQAPTKTTSHTQPDYKESLSRNRSILDTWPLP
jgi:Bacterial regulatory proteins, luxR family